MKFIPLSIFCFLCTISFSQDTKQIHALRITDQVTIDGKMDEEFWSSIPEAGDFVNLSPNPGTPSQSKSVIQLAYDDEALYIGAFLSSAQDSIMTELSERDDYGNTDYFGIILDTYGNSNDGFMFFTGSTGVQMDAKLTTNGDDKSWDAVWFNAVEIHENGWAIEMKIPYSALRFPQTEVQSWNINFLRNRAIINEESVWNEIDPETNNAFLNQMGQLQGIRDIKPPIRLSISPYASFVTQNSHDQTRDQVDIFSSNYSFGADIKYGINDAFTLDMTLIPDFSQVQSDDLILNLSPFEQRYSENRPFFTEGLELFNRGNLFYSRRVGGAPIGLYDFDVSDNEEIVSNPANTRLYNASKLSGRTKKGLGIGVFNAISEKTVAKIENMETGTNREVVTAPLSNYNVMVLDQTLANNSSVTFTNTNVWRQGNLFYDANVSGLEFDIKNKKQSYSVAGRFNLSQKYYAEADNIFGHNYSLFLRKISGNFTGGFGYFEESPDYDPNDLGFLSNANQRTIEMWANYSLYEPFGAFNRGNFWFNYNYDRLADPNVYTGMHFNTGFWVQTKSFWNFNMWANWEPTFYNYFEPRVEGRFYARPYSANTGIWIGSDNRKKLRVQGSIFWAKVNEEGRNFYEINLGPRYRFSNNFTLSFGTSYNIGNNNIGWVETSENEDVIYFGRRDRKTVSNNISAMYSFNDKMSLDFRLRHYWSKAVYNKFYELGVEGDLQETDYSSFQDFTFNQFNIDMTYRWRFAPGSDIILVWKNNISGGSSDELIDYSQINYKNGLDELRQFEQVNSLSVRVIYYLDYQKMQRMWRGKV